MWKQNQDSVVSPKEENLSLKTLPTKEAASIDLQGELQPLQNTACPGSFETWKGGKHRPGSFCET